VQIAELIVHSGIHDAIARKLNEKGELSKNAIAEGIINNVRKTIIRDQLTDPRFYAEMSKLLDDLIKQSRADAAAYETFLKKAEELVKRMAKKDTVVGVPTILHGKLEATVIYNNLADILRSSSGNGAMVVREESPIEQEQRAELALKIDQAMREHAPAGWKGDETREKQVLNALFPIMSRDREATQAIFEIIKNQPGY
jgi:type I restriction enzyme, R subunit